MGSGLEAIPLVNLSEPQAAAFSLCWRLMGLQPVGFVLVLLAGPPLARFIVQRV